ncbi:hypothetical protein M0R72_08450 [Candidatus Pacearchaeota archaeon]|jgi:hypothetical protein|nr:hypothetical protein [Candidatus Pacearchaeota archaeon]
MAMDEYVTEVLENLNPEMVQKIAENFSTIDEYNCFGFVAAWFGWNPVLTVELEEDIMGHLSQNATETESIEGSDIVAWFENDEITHIGVVVSARDETYLGKMGGLELAIDDVIRGNFDYGTEIKYYKVN